MAFLDFSVPFSPFNIIGFHLPPIILIAHVTGQLNG